MTTLWKMKEKRGTHGWEARKRCKVENTIYTAGRTISQYGDGFGCADIKMRDPKNKERDGRKSEWTDRRENKQRENGGEQLIPRLSFVSVFESTFSPLARRLPS